MAYKNLPFEKEIIDIMRNEPEFLDTFGAVWNVKLPTMSDHPKFFKSLRNKETLPELKILRKLDIKMYNEPYVVIKGKYRSGYVHTESLYVPLEENRRIKDVFERLTVSDDVNI